MLAIEKAPMKMSPSLESFPTEIKLSILHSIPNHEALRTLIPASPDYYACYRLSPDQILTRVTLSELRTSEVNVLVKVDFAEVCLHDGRRPNTWLYGALEKIQRQLGAGLPVQLSDYDCMMLRSLIAFKGFRPNPNDPRHFDCVTHDDESHYGPYEGIWHYSWRHYHLLRFVYDANGMAQYWMQEQMKAQHIAYGRRQAGKTRREETQARKAAEKEEAKRQKAGMAMVRSTVEKKRLLKAHLENMVDTAPEQKTLTA
ncbi:MAG: hypothetical protein Q9218_004656 [Villophora microphyllina]